MEIKFNSKLGYQEDAINSVIGLFEGQKRLSSRFSISSGNRLDVVEGIGNRFSLTYEEIEKNFKEVQKVNNLNENESLESLDFTIEMETGTGKTYVYLKTILELYSNFGFSKFVIVVPSVAIKEGVKKTLDLTRAHFEELYNNLNYHDFVFDSNNLTELENFAKDDNIQIMIITIQSFNQKEKNKIRQKYENGVIPINYISSSQPIVIIDEPQTTSSTDKQKEAISDLNPLFTLQYSATPKDAKNIIYKLDAVDAYNKNLVKKIEVDAFDAADYQNKPYIQLDSVNQNKKGKRTAKMYLIVNGKTGYKKELKSLNIGDYLHVPKITNNPVYDGYFVEDVGVGDNKFVRIVDNEDNSKVINLGQIVNDINQEAIRQEQIEETIKEHLRKERKLADKNIKVLSLFFIDEVKNYRDYDREDGKGKYARWFEKAYSKLIKDDEFQDLPEHILNVAPEDVHDGYFSIDNKKWANTSGKKTADATTYEKIMKDKEKLLNPKDNLRFIFSHSALKEGWDNPNVFQICTLIETQSDMSKRQKIGRGLRLCVDGDGNRIDENYGDGEEYKNINRLTVLANESFENFASSLQKEMEEDGIKFAVVEKKHFIGIKYVDKEGKENKIRDYDAAVIIRSLIKQELIDKKTQKITKKWKTARDNGEVDIPSDYESIKGTIIQIIDGKVPSNYVSNKKDMIKVKLNQNKLDAPEFNNLWDRIKFKTRYHVELDTDVFIENCVHDMGLELKHIQKNRVTHTRTDVKFKNEVTGITRTKRSHFIDVEHDEIPNIVKDLQDKTHLTRKTIIDILIKSNERNNTLEKLLINPTEYFNKTLEIINDNLNHALVKNIEYVKTENIYDKFGFTPEIDVDLKDDKFVKTEKSIYEYIGCDSRGIEVSFAKELEKNDDVKLFVKLPIWFKINTPVGHYNPDWAITLEIDGVEETYFVIETKGTTSKSNLRDTERDRIDCGIKHFEALGNVTYDKCVTFDEFVSKYLYEPF